MFARLSALVIWALVAATAVFWGLRLWTRSPEVPPNALTVGTALPRGDLTRLFGSAPAEQPSAVVAPEMASRFRLVGVMAPRPGRTAAAPKRYGVALIAVDGQPAKAFAVGAALDGELVLQSVSLRSASIGPAQGDPALMIELPPLQPPATGVMPSAVVPIIPGAVLPPGLSRSYRMTPPAAINPTPAPAPSFPAPNPDLGQPENINGGASNE